MVMVNWVRWVQVGFNNNWKYHAMSWTILYPQIVFLYSYKKWFRSFRNYCSSQNKAFIRICFLKASTSKGFNGALSIKKYTFR